MAPMGGDKSAQIVNKRTAFWTAQVMEPIYKKLNGNKKSFSFCFFCFFIFCEKCPFWDTRDLCGAPQ